MFVYFFFSMAPTAKRKCPYSRSDNDYTTDTPLTKNRDKLDICLVVKGGDKKTRLANKVFQGFACGFKFKGCFELEKEKCQYLNKDTMVTVPEVLDVTVLETGHANPNSDYMLMEDHFFQETILTAEGDVNMTSRGIEDNTTKAISVQSYVSKNQPLSVAANKENLDYILMICTKSEYPKILARLRELKRVLLGDEFSDILCALWAWQRVMHEYNPVWSKYYQWTKTSKVTRGIGFKNASNNQPIYTHSGDGDTFENSGSYTCYEHNIADYLTTGVNPNRSYHEGLIFAFLGPRIKGPGIGTTAADGIQNDNMQWWENSLHRIRVFYKTKKVAYGDLYFNSRALLPKYKQDLKDQSLSIINLKGAKGGGTNDYDLDFYLQNSEFYSIDTLNVGPDMSGATGDVYGPEATFCQGDIIPPDA